MAPDTGPESTGLPDVMKTAGLTVGGFYRHFDSKSALFREAVGSSLRRTLAFLRHSPGGRRGSVSGRPDPPVTAVNARDTAPRPGAPEIDDSFRPHEGRGGSIGTSFLRATVRTGRRKPSMVRLERCPSLRWMAATRP